MASQHGVKLPRSMESVDFLRIFLPYELRLAQRRAMVWGSAVNGDFPNVFIGLYLVRLETATATAYPAPERGGDRIGAHARDLLHEVLRDSDIPFILSDREYLAVLRDIDPEHAYVVAQRLLCLANRSELFQRAGIRTRIGYIVYPLSFQPNFPAEEWETLVGIARDISGRGHPRGPAAGYGVLRGSNMTETSIIEADLVALIQRDPDSLVHAGLLQLQRIHLSSEGI